MVSISGYPKRNRPVNLTSPQSNSKGKMGKKSLLGQRYDFKRPILGRILWEH